MPDPVFLSGADVPSYLKGVELMTAGMEWNASTGPVTITREHIADAIVACNHDPHIQPPRIKLGHGSPLNGDHPNHDPFAAIGDAEPAFGIFDNLASNNDGAVLIGDADNVLTWLALSAPATYPNRSSEATWQVAAADFDVQTAGGKRYQMVVTAVSLLGVYIPAISDLEDLSTLIMSGPSALPASQPAVAAAASPGTQLSVSTSVVRERFNFEWAMDADNGVEQNTYWWWARDIRVDDDEVIADDDEGGLWSVPYSTDGADAVTFGEPTRVRETFVPVAAAAQVATFARPSKPSSVQAASTTAATERPNTEGAEHMGDPVREFLVGQGHDPDTATEAQVTAAEAFVAAFPAAPAAEVVEPATPETPATPATPVAEAPVEPVDPRVPIAAAAAAVAAAAAPQASSLTMPVDRATFEAMQSEVALGRQERRGRERETLSATTTAAVLDGRIASSVREAWLSAIDPGDDPTPVEIARAKAEQTALAALPAGRIPLAAKGMAPDPEAEGFPISEPLPDNVSLLTPGQRAELRARRGA